MKTTNHLFLDDTSIDFFVYAIKTQDIPDYLWVFQLNQFLSYNFERIEDFQAKVVSDTFEFIQYNTLDPETHTEFHLYKNKSLEKTLANKENSLFEEIIKIEYLFPKFQQFNYILKSNTQLSEEFLLLLSGFESIISIQDISNTEYKFLQNLIS